MKTKIVEAIPINLHDNYIRRVIFVVLCEFIIFTQLIFITYSPSGSKDNTIQNNLPDPTLNETITQDNPNPTENPTEIIPTEDPREENPNEETSNQENISTQNPTEQEEAKYFDIPLEEDLQNYIFKLCGEYNIDPCLIVSMIYVESSYVASTIGDNGESFGLMQIQPKWHQWRMDKLNCQDLLNPYQNITVGVDILSELLNGGKSVEWVLMAYNGGPDYADAKLAIGEVSDYANKVLRYADELERR